MTYLIYLYCIGFLVYASLWLTPANGKSSRRNTKVSLNNKNIKTQK